MRHVFLIIGLGFILFGCKKEDTTPETPTNEYTYVDNSNGTFHYSWFKGIITDVNGNPVNDSLMALTGTPCNFPIGINNGAYKAKVCRIVGGTNAISYPTTVTLRLYDTLWNQVDVLTFSGGLLIENDTIIVNFQL